MIKPRKITVSIDKKDEQTDTIPYDPKHFEHRTAYLLHKLERVGAKAFVGVCIYVLLDTYRKIKVAEASRS